MHDYGYPDASPRWQDDYVWAPVRRELAALPSGARVIELGCGNGVAASRMHALGLQVTAVEPSPSGIAAARAAFTGPRFELGSADERLAERLGTFDAVVSIEVIEHCLLAQRFARCCFELLEPGGLLVLTTPYHGYVKNLALAVTGKLDAHFEATRDGGHIKFFSTATITQLLTDAGFTGIRVARVGRIAPLAKSMIVTARKP